MGYNVTELSICFLANQINSFNFINRRSLPFIYTLWFQQNNEIDPVIESLANIPVYPIQPVITRVAESVPNIANGLAI